jgi:hypothetical protein
LGHPSSTITHRLSQMRLTRKSPTENNVSVFSNTAPVPSP